MTQKQATNTMKYLLYLFILVIFAARFSFGSDANTLTLTGSQLNACVVACNRFKEKETNAGLEHYTVIVSQQSNIVAVLFVPNGLKPSATKRGALDPEARRQVQYSVDAETGKIVKTSYVR